MVISKLHASHIKEVNVGFVISSLSLNPEKITKALGIVADLSAKRGDARKNFSGQSLKPHEEGFWRIDTRNKIESKDINDHFHYLLNLLLPYHEIILNFSKNGETFFDVLWKSTYLYAGTGPIINAESIAGIGKLNASIGFDIYQLDDEDSD